MWWAISWSSMPKLVVKTIVAADRRHQRVARRIRGRRIGCVGDLAVGVERTLCFHHHHVT
jgi:hypothetical protein